MTKKNYNKCLILYKKTFKHKLEDKTVMFSPREDGAYNRHMHTMDVVKTAELISNKIISSHSDISINFEALEIAALFHDVGHCPFGHHGEIVLNDLLSKRGYRYDQAFFCGYKHNLYSSMLVLRLTNYDVSEIVLDSIIKHSSCLPSNFNVSMVAKYNLLKLNYAFRLDYENENKLHHKSWQKFIQSIDHDCKKCSIVNDKSRLVNEDCGIGVCGLSISSSKKFFIKIENEKKNISYKLAKYFLHQKPTFLEGYILYYADEFASLCNDLKIYSLHIKSWKDNQSANNIIFKEIINSLECIASFSSINMSMQSREFIDLCICIFKKQEEVDECYKKMINLLCDNLVVKKKEQKCNVHSKFKNGYSIELSEDMDFVFNQIKKTVYNIMHRDEHIVNNNCVGEKLITKYFNYLYNNPDEFFKLISISKTNKILYVSSKIARKKINSIDELVTMLNCNCCSSSEVEEVNSKQRSMFRRYIAFYIIDMTEKQLIDACSKI